MDYFEQKEAEYRAAVAKQEAERRAEAHAKRAEVKKEADEIYAGLLEAFPAPERPAVPPRPFLDMVREHLDSLTPQERARLRNEEYRTRRQALVDAETRQPRNSAEELGADLVNPPEYDWGSVDDEGYDD